MFNRAAKAFLIVAMLATIGAHWAILQSVAWSTMLANNLQSGSLYQAVVQTFDGDHPCTLCKRISTGKQSEKKSEFRLAIQKLEFVSNRQIVVFVPPQHFQLLTVSDALASAAGQEPPVPPPRALFT